MGTVTTRWRSYAVWDLRESVLVGVGLEAIHQPGSLSSLWELPSDLECIGRNSPVDVVLIPRLHDEGAARMLGALDWLVRSTPSCALLISEESLLGEWRYLLDRLPLPVGCYGGFLKVLANGIRAFAPKQVLLDPRDPDLEWPRGVEGRAYSLIGHAIAVFNACGAVVIADNRSRRLALTDLQRSGFHLSLELTGAREGDEGGCRAP